MSLSTPNPYAPLGDSTAPHEFLVLPTNDTQSSPTDEPTHSPSLLHVFTTFHANGETEPVRLHSSIDLMSLVDEFSEDQTLRTDTYEIIKTLSIHSVLDAPTCDDFMVQRFIDHLSSNLFKLTGILDPNAITPVSCPLLSSQSGIQRFYDDAIHYHGAAEIIPSLAVELAFRIRVTSCIPNPAGPIHCTHTTIPGTTDNHMHPQFPQFPMSTTHTPINSPPTPPVYHPPEHLPEHPPMYPQPNPPTQTPHHALQVPIHPNIPSCGV
jgi:hypothetical protein